MDLLPITPLLVGNKTKIHSLVNNCIKIVENRYKWKRAVEKAKSLAVDLLNLLKKKMIYTVKDVPDSTYLQIILQLLS